MTSGSQLTSWDSLDGLGAVVPWQLTDCPEPPCSVQRGGNPRLMEQTTKELFFRWVSLGLMPVIRLHHGVSGCK